MYSINSTTLFSSDFCTKNYSQNLSENSVKISIKVRKLIVQWLTRALKKCETLSERETIISTASASTSSFCTHAVEMKSNITSSMGTPTSTRHALYP